MAQKAYHVTYIRLYNRAVRRALKMSQGALGEAIGTNATQVCWYEHGKSDEIVTRHEYDITKCLTETAECRYKPRSAEYKLFFIQVWLYYREELKIEELLTKGADKEIQEYIRGFL